VKRRQFVVIVQNMTEGAPPKSYWDADVLLLSETNHKLLRQESPEEFDWYFPERDPHQAIGWNSLTFAADKNRINGGDYTRTIRFHRSGAAEGWLNRKRPVRTPARFLHEVDLVHITTDQPFTFGAMWWLNSWRHERFRRWIVKTTTIPVVRDRMRRCADRGRLGIYGGDTNHVTFDFVGFFDRYRVAFRRGLDHVFWLRSKWLELLEIHHGPKVGVGTQMRHHSLVARFKVTARHAENEN
jgi:hypothetical protein